MQKLYLYRLYRYNRKLFFGIAAFAFITITCNVKGYELTPFFIWAMYSQKEADAENYYVQQIVVNGSLKINNTTAFTPSTRFLLSSPLWYYISIQKNNGDDPTKSFLQSKLKDHYAAIKPYEQMLFNDSNRIQAFIPWYKKYLEEVTKVKIYHLQIINAKVHYKGKKIITDTSYTVTEWKQL